MRGRASIYFSFLSTYIAKEEGILPCGVFGVASALITPLSNWIFLSSIFLAKLLGFAFGATSSSLSLFISCSLYVLIKIFILK